MTKLRAFPLAMLFEIGLAASAPAEAFPYLTLTLFGDRPALEHVAKPLVGKDLIAVGQQRTAPSADSGPSRADAPAVQAPVAVQTYIPGLSGRPAPSAGSMPIAPVASMQSLDDTRLIDEADAQLSVANYTTSSSEATAAPANEAEIAQAVREAADAARASRVDRTMQNEVAAELDDDLELIEFGEIDPSLMIGLTEEGGGVLGLVEVTKVSEVDHVVVDEEGRLVTVEDSGDASDLVQWQSNVLGEIPVLATSVSAIGPALPGQEGGANQMLMQKMISLSQPGSFAVNAVSARQMASMSASHVVSNFDAFSARSSSASGSARGQNRQFSVELLIAFVKSIFTRSETYVGISLMAVIGLILRRFARTSSARV